MSATLQIAQVANLPLSGGSAPVVPIAMGLYPGEGSVVVSLQYNFANAISMGGLYGFAEVISPLVALGVQSTIQAVWIDNGMNALPVTFYIPASNQCIYVPAGYQGVYPAFFSGMGSYQLSVTAPISSGYTRISLLNVPVNAAQWESGAPSGMGANIGLFNFTQTFSVGLSTLIKAGPGRLWNVQITANTVLVTAGTYLGDTLTVATLGNAISSIPIGNVGTVDVPGGVPFYTGLVLTWGPSVTGGTLSITYS